jgi:hypothetical protein
LAIALYLFGHSCPHQTGFNLPFLFSPLLSNFLLLIFLDFCSYPVLPMAGLPAVRDYKLPSIIHRLYVRESYACDRKKILPLHNGEKSEKIIR